MGIINTTPDSFSDGGRLHSLDAVLRHAEALVHDGADILDIGGESTRPGALPVDADVESSRVLNVIEALVTRQFPVALSIDTRKAVVAERAMEHGAHIINDVSAMGDDAMSGVVARHGAVVILMHMRGEPQTMQQSPGYDDVVGQVCNFLAHRRDVAVAAGVPRERIWLDPGLGFGKTLAHNITLVRHLSQLAALGQPVVLGASRKAFLGALTGHTNPAERDPATAAVCAIAITRGATIIRVHNPRAVRDAVHVAAALRDGL